MQNNNELRATGGFMGSYAKVKINAKGLERIDVQDIYVPDGQLPGHVEPPYPIQEAFRQGWWKLRDANWDPDFASAAATVKWFLEEGGEKPVDGIIAVNLDLIQKTLGVIGSIKVEGSVQTINASSVYSIIQKSAEQNSFPGSTQKKDFIGAAEAALLQKVKVSNPIIWLRLGILVKTELDKGQVWVWLPGVKLSKWGGGLQDHWLRGDDYLYIVESNLGANKANCCVNRKVTQIMNGKDETLMIDWNNSSEYANPLPAIFWGGDYWDYVRVIIPSDSNIQRIRVSGRELGLATANDFDFPNSLRQSRSGDIYVIEKRGELQIVGFWAEVSAGGNTRAELNYKSQIPLNRVLVRRQPGIESFDYKFISNDKTINKIIDEDAVVSSR